MNFEEHLAVTTYYDKQFKAPAIKLLPGEYFVSATGTLMTTVLGSCISVCLFDQSKGIGGMNHFMLVQEIASPNSASARYGAYAMEILVNHLMKLGCSTRNLKAKVFGAGKVLSSLNSIRVGDKNAAFALSYLKNENIPVIGQDVLGEYPRRVYFWPTSGKVLVRTLKTQPVEKIINQEDSYLSQLAKEPIAGEIDLF